MAKVLERGRGYMVTAEDGRQWLVQFWKVVGETNTSSLLAKVAVFKGVPTWKDKPPAFCLDGHWKQIMTLAEYESDDTPCKVLEKAFLYRYPWTTQRCPQGLESTYAEDLPPHRLRDLHGFPFNYPTNMQ